MTASENAIDVEGLTVVYPDGTRAVEQVSFHVRQGEFFGFLGPNGAGKSTTIKTLTTLLPKSAGTVRVAGLDLDRASEQIRHRIGVLNQDTVLDVDLTGRENIRLLGHLQQLRGEPLERRVDELLKVVGLEEAADKPAGRYSGGMRKRLDLASALVHKPRILFLDEPTTGLDPQSRAAIWDYLERLNRDEGVTIFLTTQYMEEADRLCRTLAIIDHGRLVGGGTPRELKESLGGDVISLELPPGSGPQERERAKSLLSGVAGVAHVDDADGGLVATSRNAGAVIADVVLALSQGGIRPAHLTISTPTLDDVFLRLTGRKIRPEELTRKTEEPFLM